MYKRKLFFFGLMTAVVLIIAILCASLASYVTKQNLQQSSIAQSLHLEHQHLSSIAYRLFKQFTDEFMFGSGANQADVRKKTVIIKQTLTKIRELEQKQRVALGPGITEGSIEDTDQLETIISEIITEFQALLKTDRTLKDQRLRLLNLLESDIDNEFREAIDTALSRQQRVVTALNARIETLNISLFWFSIGVGVISLLFLIYGCYWLFAQLYKPLTILQTAADHIAEGDYKQTITEKLDDEFDAIVNAFNRLSERLLAHEEKEKYSREQLEFQVEQRTTELVNANAQLTAIDAKRRQFINDISHELRTPLTIIRGEAQVTLRIGSSSLADYKDTLQSVENHAIKLGRLVDDLLLLARSEMDKLNLQLARNNLYELVLNEIDKWKRIYETPAIEIEADPNATELELFIDGQRIEQVVSILLDNAFKYANTEQPIIVRLYKQADKVTVEIEDKGLGIAASEISHIFERFVRFKNTENGYGLGLPIAKTIIEGHGGDIHVTSVQGEFTRFTFSLPMELTQ